LHDTLSFHTPALDLTWPSAHCQPMACYAYDYEYHCMTNSVVTTDVNSDKMSSSAPGWTQTVTLHNITTIMSDDMP